jgi:hypothetical protein
MTNAHTHFPATAPKHGYSGIFSVRSIQVHPLWRLLVDWAWSGLGGGGATWLNSTWFHTWSGYIETGCTSASWSVVCVHLVSGYVLLLVLANIQLQPYILLRHDLCDSPIFLSTLSSSCLRISFPSSCHLTLFRSVEFIFNIYVLPTSFSFRAFSFLI